MLKAVVRAVAPSEGSLFVDGMDVSKEENVIPVRKTAGMVFQNPDNQIMVAAVVLVAVQSFVLVAVDLLHPAQPDRPNSSRLHTAILSMRFSFHAKLH